MRFYTFVLKNLIRRRVRTALTMLGIAVAVGAVVALVGVSSGFERSFLELYEKRQVDIIVSRKGLMDRLTSGLDENFGKKIAGLPGVKAVATGLLDFVSLEKLGIFGVMVQGWPDDCFMFDELGIVDGRRLRKGDDRGILLGKVLATNLNKKPGDKLVLFDEEFTVVGVYQTFNVYENGSMITLLAPLQKLMGREKQITGCTVVLEQHDRPTIDQMCLKIDALDPAGKTKAMPYEEYVRSTSQIKAAQAMAWMTSVLALIIGTVGMLNTMVMSVFERTREIGILRAIGWRRSRVVRMILLEAILLSMTGGLVGTLAAIGLTRFLSSRPSVAGMIGGQIDPRVILQGFGIALLVGLIGAAYPAYRAARLMPTEAIRHE